MFNVRRSSLIRYGAALLLLSAGLLLVWPNLIARLFSAEGYEAHGYCYLWEPPLVSLHVISDFSIGMSYVAISLTLAYLVHRARRDIPFHWIFLAFGAFIIACGSTHFLEIWTLWVPTYWFSGGVKLVTAVASVATAFALPPLIPKTLGLVNAAKTSNERKLKLEAANQELEALYARSQELDQLKTQFFANVSHELRTPLALILGPTGRLLNSNELSEAQRRDLEVVERNAHTLLKHVNDLLDISKLDAGKMGLSYGDVDLAATLRLTASHFDALAREKAIDFAVEAPAALPAQADRPKLQRVFLNLLSNAFKFTPNGGRVRAALEATRDAAIVTVEDNGPGVPPAMRAAIFERFWQGDGGATRHFEGTGLGLAIAREFVELHGGRIAVADAPGGGARFRVELPLHTLEPAGAHEQDVDAADVAELALQSPAEPRPQGGTARPVERKPSDPLVLVVEDNPDMSRFIVETLAVDYRTTVAFDGRSGLAQARALRPDLIVSDVMMPELSGDQLVRAVRRAPELAATPIMLVSARADDRLRVQALRDGAQDYVLKPFLPEELHARASNLLRTKRARETLQRQLASQSQDLEVLATEARDAIRIRDEFLSVASHELKTPVTALIAYAQILERRIVREAPVNERNLRAVQVIYEQSERLNRLIAALLDVSRLQSGRLELERRPLDLCALTRRVVDAFEPTLSKHTLVLQCQGTGLPIEGDETRLEQVLHNLIANAVKYSPRGGPVEVRVDRHGAEARIVVRDEGVGIPLAEQERIFQQFYRGGNIDAENVTGFGIGLYVVQEIVQRHGGRVEVASVEGQGSTFTVFLPASSKVD
jgi:signal transduction histidine kinase